MSSKRELIKTIDNEGKVLELAVIRPGHKNMQDANMRYNLKLSRLIREAANGGDRLLLRSEVENHLIKTGIWTNGDVLAMERYSLRIRAIQLIIQKGGIKLSEARKLALEMSTLRAKIMELYNKKQQLDFATVEAVAENDKFAFLMTCCVVYADKGDMFFKDEDDYIERGNETAVVDAAKCLAKMVYGLNDDITMSYYENKWLKEHGFIDNAGRLTDSDGNFINEDGKRVNEIGQFIDKDGNLVDKSGIKVDKDGNFVLDNSKPFLDDNGEPIIKNDKIKKGTTKRKRKKVLK
jgi:hypothetical protein